MQLFLSLLPGFAFQLFLRYHHLLRQMAAHKIRYSREIDTINHAKILTMNRNAQ